jgi:hypothetical protein
LNDKPLTSKAWVRRGHHDPNRVPPHGSSTAEPVRAPRQHAPSRCKRRNARNSTPLRGCTLGVPPLTLRKADVVTPHSERFDNICAELRSYGSSQMNELEMGDDDAHILLMRCEGTSSRSEILWMEDKRRQVLPEIKPGSILFCPAGNRARIRKRDKGRSTDILLRIPPSALDLLNDMQLRSAHARLTPQAGCGRDELCHILFAMRDEILCPGPAGRI